jgi:uncharacterized protein with HEPN domain
MRRHRTAKVLHDVLDAGESVARLTAGMSFDEYLHGEAVRLAVERQFITIGEALTQLDRADPAAVAQIEHAREIIGFRNVLVHGYSVIDDRVVWGAVQGDLPVLLHRVRQLLEGA